MPTVAGEIKFAKYHGLGNDFILLDNRDSLEPPISPAQAAKICDRNFGVGGDGVIFALRSDSDDYDYKMRIYNSDGSEPEMCGNGIRCLARFVADEDGAPPRAYRVDTLAGLIVPDVLEDGRVTVDMGEPILSAPQVPTTLAGDASRGGAAIAQEITAAGAKMSFTCVSMGNPHAITFVDSLDAFELATYGPAVEAHEVFPAKVNAEFVEVVSRDYVKMKVWERGAGPTLACGTGACATVVACVLEGKADRECIVELPGGPLSIEWREADNRIYMTGPAEAVFGGMAALPTV